MSDENVLVDYDEWSDDETCIVLAPRREQGVYAEPVIEDDIPGAMEERPWPRRQGQPSGLNTRLVANFDDPEPELVPLDVIPRGGSSTFLDIGYPFGFRGRV
jgi:hypothetical protein